MERKKSLGQLDAEGELEEIERLIAKYREYANAQQQIEDLEVDRYKLLKKLRGEEHKEKLEYIEELETASGDADYSAMVAAYGAMLAENEQRRQQDLISQEEYTDRKKELLKLQEDAIEKAAKAAKKQSDKLTVEMAEATDKTISQIDRFIAQQKEMDGLKDDSGNVYSFTSEDEIAAIQKQIAANEALIASLRELEATEEGLTDSQKTTLKQRIAANEEYYDRIQSLQVRQMKDIQEATEQLSELNQKYTEDMAAAGAKYAESVEAVNRKLDESLEKAHADYVSKVDAANKKLADGEKQLTETYENELKQRQKSLMNFVDIFSEVTKKDVSGKQLLQNLQDQLDMMKDWQENYVELSGKIADEGLLKELYDMGPEAADELAALNSLTDEELDEYVRIYREKNALAAQEAEKQMAAQRAEMQRQMQQLRADTAMELEQLSADYTQKMAELRESAANELAKHSEDWTKTTEGITAKYAEESAKINDALENSTVKRGEMLMAEQKAQGEQEQKKTENTRTELTRQEIEVRRSGDANINTLKSFVPVWKSIGEEYGNMLLAGIQNTRWGIIGYLSAVAAAVREAQSGRDKEIPEYAHGTQSAAQGLALVGEVGPEIVDFSGGEQVLSFRNSLSLLGDAISSVSEGVAAVNAYQEAYGNLPSTDRAASSQVIDYKKLARTIAAEMKPSITYNPVYNSPKPASIKELRLTDKINMRRLGLSF